MNRIQGSGFRVDCLGFRHVGDAQNTFEGGSYKQTLNVIRGFDCPLRHEAARRVNRTFCRVALDSLSTCGRFPVQAVSVM